ncbi:MAG: ankyrin repeat domain-containing protein [Pseudomonas sp.]|uniref:ankyrin repeat domain-containing protein n=1 Tax=Pseudomonas sp. TaxID=306 RepID=UPI003391F5BF
MPTRPDLGHLKKQAKTLLAGYRSGDPDAARRLRTFLPAAAGKSDPALQALNLRLHDAQSCLAREYGFVSWADLQGFVDARRAQLDDPLHARLYWLRLVYAGDISGGTANAKPQVAARLLQERGSQVGEDPYLACAFGDEALVRLTCDRDPGWVNRPGGPLNLPPLMAVTHSSLLQLPAFRHALLGCARILLEAGANPNQAVGSRWAKTAVAEADGSEPLSALYGAAGRNRDPEVTQLLLDAGANPNDGESLYHSLENPACTRLLLAAGARLAGTNALYRLLDFDDLETLRLLLDKGADANGDDVQMPAGMTPLLWAIRRRRSGAHIQALLAAGANPRVQADDGVTPYIQALRYGLQEVAALLQQATGDAEALPAEEGFIAACARGDATTARRLHGEHPQWPGALSEPQLRLLPELAAQGCQGAVKLMVELGWPIATLGGDWNASALNQAVFRGDAQLTRWLLEHGARWQERHGYGDNACGTLSWASNNRPIDDGDWLGCAQALLAHGLPHAAPDPQGSEALLIDGRLISFSDEVSECLLGIT